MHGQHWDLTQHFENNTLRTTKMATGGHDKKGKGNDNTPKMHGLTTSLVFTGGALAGAVLLYGVKKLYEYISPPTEKSIPKKLDDEDVETLRRGKRAELSQPTDNWPNEAGDSLMLVSGEHTTRNLAVPNINITSPQSDSSLLSVTSLHDSLLDYYTNYVVIPELDQGLALTVVEDVKDSVHYILDELMPGTPLIGMYNIGPSAEGLNVIYPDVYQVVLQLNLDPKLWEFVDAGETLLGAHGYQMVKRTHLEFFSRGVTPYDKFLIGEYLSPQKVKTAFMDCTHRVNNWRSSFQIQSAVIGPDVKLFVQYTGRDGDEVDRTITIELIPGVTLDGTQVLATTHSNSANNLQKPGFANLWMQSFAETEYSHLMSWKPSAPSHSASSKTTTPKVVEGTDSTDITGVTRQPNLEVPASPVAGCQLMCLKLLEAVRLNHPAQLGLLTSYAVRTIVMHLLTVEDGWHEEELSERFLDTLKALEEALHARVLPHYFCPKLNLFQDQDPGTLDMARNFITAIVGNNQFPALLKTNY